MIETLISSKTRIKLLLKFFLNSSSRSYLRGLETEFGDSTNAIRQELNRFEKAGMLKASTEGNKKYFQANTDHPLYKEVHNILIKYIGFDTIIDTVIDRLGEIKDTTRDTNTEVKQLNQNLTQILISMSKQNHEG